MANINEVLAKAYELHGGIKSLLRLSTFNEYDDLSSLDINYKDAEQLLLLDELRSIMDKLSDVDSKLSYLSLPIKETSRLHRNENGKFETKGGHYYSCGYGIEALVQDDCHEAPYWMHTRIEHNGSEYYLVGCSKVKLDGLTVRVREVRQYEL